MTTDQARREAYNALRAAGHSHEDAMQVIRQMEAPADPRGTDEAGEIRGEGVALPSPSPRKNTRSEAARMGALGLKRKFIDPETGVVDMPAYRAHMKAIGDKGKRGRPALPTYDEIVQTPEGRRLARRIAAQLGTTLALPAIQRARRA